MNELKIQAKILWVSFALLSLITVFFDQFNLKSKAILILIFTVLVLLPGFLFDYLSKKKESSTGGKVGMWILASAILICFLIILTYLPSNHSGGDYGGLILLIIPPIYIVGLLISIILVLLSPKIKR